MLQDLFQPPDGAITAPRVAAAGFERLEWCADGNVQVMLDRVEGEPAACVFVRFAPGREGSVRFVVDGVYGWSECASGGWLLRPSAAGYPVFWLPQPPIHRKLDANGRILSEIAAAPAAVMPDAQRTTVRFSLFDGATLDVVVWRFPSEQAEMVAALEDPRVLERQPHFMWASHTSLRGPADVYRFLVHGHVYEDRFDWRRKRRICSELEAWSLYVALLGLESATGKSALYRPLRLQIVGSVLARQAADGGWHHGEWTDFMEAHYRFHCAAMHTLMAALEEVPDATLAAALDEAAAVLAASTDRTDIGLWFMHDSLERSAELTDKSGIRWIPSRELGKSPTNKMILNSHLDAIVALDRYRQVRGDARYAADVDSALAAARALLGLRPAEPLYRALYWAVGLTLRPARAVARMGLPLRVVRRLARDHLAPNLHRVKRRFPRMVMPGGLIERHLSRLHFGTNYHSVNVADLTRLWRRFPAEAFGPLLEGALGCVVRTGLLEFWREADQKQALGYWVEALYQLCERRDDVALRRHLADAMLCALDAGLGLSPSLLGANPEVVRRDERTPCPSPADARLRIANLGRAGHREWLVVNPAAVPIPLAWERDVASGMTWSNADGPLSPPESLPLVPPGGFVLGRERRAP